MATTLTYGFVKPATGDKGSTFWPALEALIQQTNDHTHNGTDSARITAASNVSVQQTVTNAGWANLADGLYKQTVTLPASLTGAGGTYYDYGIDLRNSANGRRVYLAMERVDDTSFYIWSNDNTLALKVIYT